MPDLFSTFNLAGVTLANRIVMAPMTRCRAVDDIADSTIALYYTQRATAGLIVSEGTPISREGQGYLFCPGIFSAEQIEGWRHTTRSVHAVGGRIFAQIWHVGRVSHPSIQENNLDPVSGTSKIAVGATAFGYDATGNPSFVEASKPRQLSTDEVGRVVEDFAQAAENAIEAGFDGVEIHGANGYLHEQFLNPQVNDRSDKYSATTIENRLRFTLEVADAIINRIGANRTAIRLSPYGGLFDMPQYPEIWETYLALMTELGRRKIAYIHIMDQSGYSMDGEAGESVSARIQRLLTEVRAQLPKTVVILTGAMTKKRAASLIEEGVIDLAGFGQPFISNPDFVARLRNNWPLTPADRSTYYGGGAGGFIDYSPYLLISTQM